MKREPFTNISGSRPAIGDVDLQDADPVARAPDASDSSAEYADAEPESSDSAGLTTLGHTDLRDVLPKHLFLQQLQRDKRRTDRSKAPLSIALFQLEGRRGDPLASANALIDLLCSSKRETDLVGALGGGLIAALLPDTNKNGADRFLRKISAQADLLPFSRSTATYPDYLFDRLLKEHRAPAYQHVLLLDEFADHKSFGRFLKRVIDIAGAVAAIVSLAPVMLMAAIAVAATSPGRIIYKQTRLGKGGVPFVFYKFRTMYSNADDRIHREYVTSLIRNENDGNRGGPAKLWSKLSDDPRITPLGKILRKTSIDELPQLFNVLKGDLSLVGPRPALPYEAENYQSWQLGRIFDVKPGISGLWQVDSRGQSTFDDMVRMDLRYIRKWALPLDLRILVDTIKVVLRRTGAS